MIWLSTSFVATRWRFLLIYVASRFQLEVDQTNSGLGKLTLFLRMISRCRRGHRMPKQIGVLLFCFFPEVKPFLKNKIKPYRMNRILNACLEKITHMGMHQGSYWTLGWVHWVYLWAISSENKRKYWLLACQLRVKYCETWVHVRGS